MDPLAPPSRGAETEGAILSGPMLTRSVMVQTDYREAETQTDLYTPEYVVLPGSQQTQKPEDNIDRVEQCHVCMLYTTILLYSNKTFLL